jgi:hypothetical protein
MQDVGQHAAGDDTESTSDGETDGITDPDTQWAGQWSYVEMDCPTDVDLSAVWGTGFFNVYAVGEDGTILHFDGTGWTIVEYEADTHPNLHVVSGAAADLIWAAGANRFLLEFDGEQWSQQETVFDLPEWPGGYRGLCAASTTAAYAVGEGATIERFTGDGWTHGLEISVLEADFHAVACSPGPDVFIAGHDHAAFASSVLIRYTPPHDWEEMDHDPSDNMYGIAADEDGTTWAVGFADGIGSSIYRLSGNEWSVSITSEHELLSLWAHASLGLWAVGNTADDDHIGVIQAWTYDTAPEYELEYGGTPRLRGIWGVDNGGDQHLIAVGKNGTILHLFWDPF